jgi:glycerol-3-phosphate dehydrogenase (NAD(P)+)
MTLNATHSHVGVLGAGAWGTALALVAAADGPVTLWARDPEVAGEVTKTRRNEAYLPGVRLPDGIDVTSRLEDLARCDVLLLVTPAQNVRAVLARALPALGRGVPLVLCAKGIEAGTMQLMSEVAAEAAPDCPCAVLSGPTFAAEVAAGLPTAVTLACEDRLLGEALMRRLASPGFRTYWTDDVIGAEVGGAVKNVLAIASGVVIGRGLGENARAAVLSRGFAEMRRFGLAKGARAETLAGLSGLGDLFLTCSSMTSRNMSLGAALGRGTSAREWLETRRTVAEGASTAPVLLAAAVSLGVEMPICEAVVDLLGERCDTDTIIERLLSRPLTIE